MPKPVVISVSSVRNEGIGLTVTQPAEMTQWLGNTCYMNSKSLAVDGIVWDLDGIVRIWGDNELLEEEASLGIAPGEILSIAFTEPLGTALCTGRMSYEDWHSVVTVMVVERFGERTKPMMLRWRDHRGSVDWDMHNVVAQSTAQIPTSLLSNGSTRLHEDLEVLGISGAWTVICNTADLGHRKPWPEAYGGACASIGTHAGRTAFIDDLETNTEAATQLGMVTHQHLHIDGTVDFLRSLGLTIQHPHGDRA